MYRYHRYSPEARGSKLANRILPKPSAFRPGGVRQLTSELAMDEVKACMDGVRNSCDNAQVETIIGLYKTEVIRARGPWKSQGDVDYAMQERVDWFNHRRLPALLGNVPPAEFERIYYDEDNRSCLAA